MFAGMLIGKEIEVLASRDSTLLGLKGLVVDETRNTLHIVTQTHKELTVPKSIVTLNVINQKKESLVIQGPNLLGTPAERIKG
jgi:ribonuclease P protein subunit POP4